MPHPEATEDLIHIYTLPEPSELTIISIQQYNKKTDLPQFPHEYFLAALIT